MSYVIYKIDQEDGQSKRWYLTELPKEDNPLGGIGYQSIAEGAPKAAGTAPTEEDARKIVEYLKTASYGRPEEHFYELAPEGHEDD